MSKEGTRADRYLSTLAFAFQNSEPKFDWWNIHAHQPNMGKNKLADTTTKTASGSAFIWSLIRSNRSYCEEISLEEELFLMRLILRSIWHKMDEASRRLFHRCEAVKSYVFNERADRKSRAHLRNADAYVDRIWENRLDCDPEYMAGDMEELIVSAWESIGSMERRKVFDVPEFASLLNLLKSTGHLPMRRAHTGETDLWRI